MSDTPGQKGSDQQGIWATPVATLTAAGAPEGAANLVDGKRVVNPLQGFGKMWQKTYRVRLDGVETTPAAVIAA